MPEVPEVNESVEPEPEPEPESLVCSVCGGDEDVCVCSDCSYCGTRVEERCSNCERCDVCCHCRVCEARRCGERVDSICSNCRHCDDCCDCYTCASCDARVSIVCDGEDCPDCCTCNDDDDDDEDDEGRRCFSLFKRRGDPQFHDGKKGEPGPSRYVSVEIEVAKADTDCVSGTVRTWGGAIVEDGSLPHSGCEINTAPAKRGDWRKQIQQICRGLANSRATVNESCGLHVHIDARDYNYYDVRRLMKLYYRLEPALFGLVSASRRSNDTCAPCGKQFMRYLKSGKMDKGDVFMGIYGVCPDRDYNKKNLKHDKYNGARYRALNLHSWIYHGTIECRLHQGSTNAEKIQMWGELWSLIVSYAADNTDKTVDALPESADAIDSYRLLRDVICAGQADLQQYLDNRVRYFNRINLELI